MSDIAIRVDGLGKRFRIGERKAAYRTLRETVVDTAKAPFVKAVNLVRGQAYGAAGLHEEIWALKDVSFEVKEGEVLGVIGPNGAGKTTLLKILSRITEPTKGRAEIHGRVGSLLEVGIGMHHELTGRENIFLNGAILGMKKEEIERRFDEIVEFSGVERFIDTPIKHYSSGMQVRLAFSVAAHLDPEILLIDEVLAVGDVEFQKKCLGKMGELASGGRTVLFVSHNLGAVRKLCTRGIFLSGGRIEKEGDVQYVVGYYLENMTLQEEATEISELEHFHDFNIQITTPNGSAILPMQPIRIDIKFCAKKEMINGGTYLGVYDPEDNILFGLDYYDFEAGACADAHEPVIFRFDIHELPLQPGTYYMRVHLKNHDVIERVDHRFPFHVQGAAAHTFREIGSVWRGRVAVKANAGRIMGSEGIWCG